ncbi:predicted protein [Histoplasma mississippiense (nom. inval.)]|uniref:predicted protein n=1 Tax=Ajellomyces capsulatus (strain NAm1 / WU24) TaxID=2059318 RepID=UPI000157D274|nr:predicted protein [Histoplasma mississippiense (nom. inval.)]EDN04415.1 predicted protein [Histoplasma mississippiense (nom. inval.)]
MNQQILAFTCCRLARGQVSPSASFVRQYHRALSIATNSVSSQHQATTYSILPYLPFLHPFLYKVAGKQQTSTYDHREWKTGLPVRSAILKPLAGRLVVGWRLREITDPSSKKPTLPVIPEGVVQDHLRVTVSSGGCHGFQYLMTLDPESNIDPEEDTIFEAEPEDSGESLSDGKTPSGRAKVVMDSASLELLSGSTVDYTMELIGSQFKITNNPRATSSCGCGTSFDVPS